MPGAVLGIEAPAGNSNFKWGALVGAAGNEQPVSGINTPVTEYGRQSSGTAGGGGPSPWLSARPPLNSAPSSSQEKNQRPTHLTGAFLAFFVGILYFWLQLFLSWRMKNLPQPGAPWIGPLRLVLCSACFVLEVASILPWSGGGSPMGWVCRAVLGAPSFLSLGLRSPCGVTEDCQRAPGLRACCLGWNPPPQCTSRGWVADSSSFLTSWCFGFLIYQMKVMVRNERSEGACEVLRWVPGTEQVNSQYCDCALVLRRV